MTSDQAPGPADFAPFRAQFAGCECPTCREVAYAASDVLDYAGRRHLAACVALLDELRAGTHHRVELADRIAELRAEKVQRLEQARARGASAADLYAIERGYVTVKMSDFYATGLGIGMTPRRRAE